MIILDTCVVSESLKAEPEPRLLEWLDAVEEEQVFLTAFTLGELQKGIERLGAGRKRDALRLWSEQLRARFAGKILPFDEAAALAWGDLSARLMDAGRPVPVVDALIAAIALRHGAILATRNIADFEPTGVKLYDPWST